MPDLLGLVFLGAVGLLLTILWIIDWRQKEDE